MWIIRKVVGFWWAHANMHWSRLVFGKAAMNANSGMGQLDTA